MFVHRDHKRVNQGTFPASDIAPGLPGAEGVLGSGVRATHWLTRTTLGALKVDRAGAACRAGTVVSVK